ncbi:zinc finger C2HC domain-containing protein 1C isoform X2 [Colossoma macropomum]|uniref:zinc finger C2HC domain-containing protein 1C isoform X2 n=1 Tax=Colossoma macropomum TaxID=42526 RepID=UPI001864898C|nr:zinc finger C2HC domain-containing protein 1C isoform X2 [Colossoma macropomum]
MKEQSPKKRYSPDLILEKLPPLRREDRIAQDVSSPSSSRLSTPRERDRRMNSPKDWEQDYSFRKNWHNPDVQRTQNSATARRKTDFEKDYDIFMEKSEMDSIFPMKPVCHKRAFNLNNCQAGNDYFKQNDRRRLDYPFPCQSQGKQTSNRRQEKQYLSKLDSFDTESHQPSRKRGETNGKSTNAYQLLYEDHYRLPGNDSRLTKEIRKKEIILQEKLLKTEEELRKIQLRTGSGNKVKREERIKNTEKAENRLYCTEKRNWDWERAIERAKEGRRNEGQRERVRDWGMGNKDDLERWGNYEIEMNERYTERREEIQQENRRRNTQRTTDCKNQKKEWDHYEEMTKQKWETARTEKDKTRRERAIEWDRRDWQEKEQMMQRANDGEKRGERAKYKTDMEYGWSMDKEYQEEQWNIMDTFKSKSHVKASSKYDKTNGDTADQQVAQERLQQLSLKIAEETTSSIRKGQSKEPAPQSAHLNQNSARLKQVELRPEVDPNAHVQLVPCKICHRCFAENRLERHSRICEKQQQSKRKTFDSAQFRAKGTDLEVFMKTNSRPKTPEVKKNNWRQKHEALIHNLRQARAPAPGGLQPQPSADVNPDYVSCPHCGRRFAPGPAERHIPKCQNIRSRPPPPRHRH